MWWREIFNDARFERLEAEGRAEFATKIEEARNNMSRAAELLGLERSHLYRKMKSLGISVRE